MITLIEALNYRCLRYVSRPLEPFHVLVGPDERPCDSCYSSGIGKVRVPSLELLSTLTTYK